MLWGFDDSPSVTNSAAADPYCSKSSQNLMKQNHLKRWCYSYKISFARMESNSRTHRGTAAALCRCCFSERKGARCRTGATRAPAASRSPPGCLCSLCGVRGSWRDLARGPALCWNPGWHRCCGRGLPLQRPHLYPVRGNCWARDSCRPPCSWYPAINAFERLGNHLGLGSRVDVWVRLRRRRSLGHLGWLLST